MSPPRHIVLGVSGASGMPIALRIAEILAAADDTRLHLIATKPAVRTLAHEIGSGGLRQLETFAHTVHPVTDIGATIASGSFPTAGMIVAPCSMRTLAAIAHGHSDNLLVRAADVHLKERRRLILMARESPLHAGHLQAMSAVTAMGAIVAPPMPAFYLGGDTLSGMVDQIASRIVDLVRPDHHPQLAQPWTGTHKH